MPGIRCEGCRKFLGTIRDATLRKGIVHLCVDCETKRKAADLAMKTKPTDNFERFMDMINKRR